MQLESPKTNHTAVTAVVCLALAAVVAAMASLNVALPEIARSTHASQTQLSWVIDAYSLVFAALLLPAGALGDRYGRRKALVAGLLIFGAGSAVAMTAGSAHELILLRGVLGLGAALVMPATLSTITSTFPNEQRTKAVGVWAAVAGGSAVLGLVSSGLLLELWSWPAVFGLNVALAAIALVGAFRVVPESADRHAPRLDLVGAGIAVVGLVSLVYSVIEAPEQGWLSAPSLAGFAIALVALVSFVLVELRREHPLLDPRIFRKRPLASGSMSVFVQFFAFFGFTFVILQYLQLVRGNSPLLAAVSVLPLAATLMPTARLAPKLVARSSARAVCAAGLVLAAAGLAVLSQLDASSSYLHMAAGLVLLGAGMGAAMTPATAAITEALPGSQQGVGSALNDLSREVGGAIGIAVVGSVLSAVYRSNVDVTGLSPEASGQVRGSFALASHLGGPVSQHAQTAFTGGMQAGLLVAAGAALSAALGVVLLLGKRSSSTVPEREGRLELGASTR
jgi:EmrB/QacA subfamily drug resistance transporter